MILLTWLFGCLQVEQHFAKFIRLYRQHEEEWKPFLTDLGRGNAPMELKVAFEEGLRYALTHVCANPQRNPNASTH